MSAQTTTIKDFAKEVEGNEMVVIKNDLIFSWTGGHTVNIYNLEGKCIDCFNSGSFKNDAALREVVKEDINIYCQEMF